MERKVLDFSDFRDVRDARQATDDAARERRLADYIYELVAALPDDRMALISEDLEIYDRTGLVPPMIESIIGRATCLADADRILRKF